MSRGGGGRPAFLGGEQVEGHHAVLELLAARRREVRRLWLADLQPLPAVLSEVEALARRLSVPVQRRHPEGLAAAAQTGAHQGVIAWAEPILGRDLDEVLKGAETFVVVLDGVTDPGNFGSVLRTAACAGVTGVVIGRHRSAPLTPAAVKAAAGAVEHVPIAVVSGIPSALVQLRRSGAWSVGLDAAGKDDLWATPVLDGPVALVLGAEGRGLAPLSVQRCDVLARIPQEGPLTSLNVAVATGVACFEVARRRALRAR